MNLNLIRIPAFIARNHLIDKNIIEKSYFVLGIAYGD